MRNEMRYGHGWKALLEHLDQTPLIAPPPLPRPPQGRLHCTDLFLPAVGTTEKVNSKHANQKQWLHDNNNLPRMHRFLFSITRVRFWVTILRKHAKKTDQLTKTGI